jgi:hypothetical protein
MKPVPTELASLLLRSLEVHAALQAPARIFYQKKKE